MPPSKQLGTGYDLDLLVEHNFEKITTIKIELLKKLPRPPEIVKHSVVLVRSAVGEAS